MTTKYEFLRHCTECRRLHNVGHPKNSALVKKYNKWCTKFGSPVVVVIGHCKNVEGKELK